VIPRGASRHLPLLATGAVFLIAFVFGAVRYDHFASWDVVRNLVLDNAFLGVAAVGATLVILTGGIDLSVGSVVAFTSIFIASMVTHRGWHPLGAIAAALVLGTTFGAMQGGLIHAFRLPSFLVTLAGMFFLRGMGFVVHPQSVALDHPFVAQTLNESASFSIPLGARGLVIPLTVDLFVITVAAAAVVLNFTRFGRRVHALGDDEHAARLLGVPVARTRIAVYAAAGFCSALAGVAFTLYQQSGDPAACKGFELDAIAAVVMGGTLLRGGVGSVLGSALGVLLFGLIQTIIAFEGTLSSWWTRIAVGALVLGFLLLQRALVSAAGLQRTCGAGR
jgi:simple sugar transport system permease protein